MTITEEFRHLGHQLYQDYDLDAPDYASFEEYLVAGLGPEQRQRLGRFLDDLLAPHRTDEEIWRVFMQADPQAGPDRRNVRRFFRDLRDHLTRQGC